MFLLTQQQFLPMNKIQDQKSAAATVKSWQQQGLNVVFTNGCFDILHVGHIRYLQASAGLGDKLVLAINADASVKKLKGDSRPVNSLEDRMEVLAALSCVDLVTSFEEETPLNIITQLVPDVLTKGGDYTVDTIVGADVVLENGGSVQVIDFVQGYSTTAVITSLKN